MLQQCAAKQGSKWTSQNMQRVIVMRLQGKTIAEIAAEFGTSEHAIRKVVWRLRAEGVSLPKTVADRPGRFDKSWTQEEIEYLVRRREEGASYEEIAKDLKRSWGGVQQMIYSMIGDGIPVKKVGSGRKRLWSVERLNAAIAGRLLLNDEDPVKP